MKDKKYSDAELDEFKNNIAREIIKTKKHLRLLENEMIRIDNKTYGISRINGELVKKDLLLKNFFTHENMW